MQKTFDRFARDLKGILRTNLHEIVIHGSYALGDFRPGQGDLDYLVVTLDDLDESIDDKLFELHDDYRRGRELHLYQLEGTFYPKRVLADPTLPFVGCYVGTGRKGWRTITTFQNSLIDLILIAERGISLLGNKLPIYGPTDKKLKNEQKVDLEKLIHVTKMDGNDENGLWQASIHWCARTLFYLENGSIGSKAEACRWCQTRPNLHKYIELFKMAENQRYPYGNTKVNDDMKRQCQSLIQSVSGIL